MITTNRNLLVASVSGIYLNPDNYASLDEDKENSNSLLLTFGDTELGNPLFPVIGTNGVATVRRLGRDSTMTYIKTNSTANLKSNKVGIYKGSTTYANFDHKTPTDELETLLTFTPTTQTELHTIYDKSENELTVKVLQGGVILYIVKGTPQEISNLTDRRIIQIRTKIKTTADSIWSNDFDHLNSFVDLLEDKGTVDYDNLSNILSTVAWDGSYIYSTSSDKKELEALDEVAYKHLVQRVIDLNFDNVSDAIEFYQSLKKKSSTVGILNRNSNDFSYSLDFTKKSIKRDSSLGGEIAQKALYAIMGDSQAIEDHPIDTTLNFSDKELIELTKAQIIYVTNSDGLAVYGDTFHLEEDIQLYIDRKLAKITNKYLGGNPIVAKDTIRRKSEAFIGKCDQSNFFTKKAELKLTDTDGKICVNFDSTAIRPFRVAEINTK